MAADRVTTPAVEDNDLLWIGRPSGLSSYQQQEISRRRTDVGQHRHPGIDLGTTNSAIAIWEPHCTHGAGLEQICREHHATGLGENAFAAGVPGLRQLPDHPDRLE